MIRVSVALFASSLFVVVASPPARGGRLLPDGRDSRAYLAHLRTAEEQAKRQQRGGWKRGRGTREGGDRSTPWGLSSSDRLLLMLGRKNCAEIEIGTETPRKRRSVLTQPHYLRGM